MKNYLASLTSFGMAALLATSPAWAIRTEMAPSSDDAQMPVPASAIAQAIGNRNHGCIVARLEAGTPADRASSFCACANSEIAADMGRIKTVSDLVDFMERDAHETALYRANDAHVRARIVARVERCRGLLN